MKSLKFIFVFLFLASFANANCFLSDTAFGKFLRQKEAGGSYRAWNEPNTNYPHIKDGYNVENITIAEVINHQTPPNRVIHVAGAYQIINTSKAPTLSSAVKSFGLDINAKFSKEIQDKIFNEYLTTFKKGRSAIHDYFYGNGDLDKAVQSIAYEWSSMPVPNSCNGAYGKALACYDELVKHMKTAKNNFKAEIGLSQPKKTKAKKKTHKAKNSHKMSQTNLCQIQISLLALAFVLLLSHKALKTMPMK